MSMEEINEERKVKVEIGFAQRMRKFCRKT